MITKAKMYKLLFQTICRNNSQQKSKNFVIKRFGLENGLPTIDISEICPNLTETVNFYTFLEGTSLPIDIALLKQIARKYKECNYLEIGTWRGESIINVSEVAKECYSISLSPEEMRKMGIKENFIEISDFFIKDIPNIKLIKCNSHTLDFSKIQKTFNLIFIDGDHSRNGVKVDTINAFKIRNKEDSIIVWHDYGLTTETINWEVFAGILEGTPKQFIKNIYHVSNTLCAVFILGKYETYQTIFPTKPNKFYSINIVQNKN